MSTQKYVFEAPDRFIIGTVGQPGERAFYLQASAAGQVVTVGLEKQEVAVLAEGLTRLIQEIRKAGGEVPPAGAGYSDRAPLEAPFEEDFHLDQLTVSWDGRRVQVEAMGGGEAVTADDVDAALGDLDPEAIGLGDLGLNEDPDHDVLQVTLSIEQTHAFVARAKDLVAAGRPTCVLCGRPDGPDGHACPRLN